MRAKANKRRVFPKLTARKLGLRRWKYTYHLVDPRYGKVFYVGSGSGDRIDFHEKEAQSGSKTPKCALIREIEKWGLKVEKRIVGLFKDRRDAHALERQYLREIPHLTNGKGAMFVGRNYR